MNTPNNAARADILKARISFRNQRYDSYLFKVWAIRHNLARHGYDLKANTPLQDGEGQSVCPEIGRLLNLHSHLKKQMRRDLEMMQMLRWGLKDLEARMEQTNMV